MCGIAGFVQRGGMAERSTIERMTATIAHRGPDGDGFYLDGPAALGHRRLSIIDVAGGAQPMSNEDGNVWITYNGELYNEPPLREALVRRGHVYRTQCDTETPIHLYEEHGEDFASSLNGMFALAIWDANRRRLVLARDRMGQKPLYYSITRTGTLVFASEPKALLAHPEVSREIDPHSLAQYLFYEYVPAPRSIWNGVNKLPPAHVLTFDAESGVVVLKRYWTPPLPTQVSNEPTFPADAARLWDRLRASVESHRRSDVPLGVFLSGGIDSSSVAAALCEVQPASSIRTYSIGFDDPSFDESSHARAVATFLGTEHHERTFSVANVLDMLPEAATWLDEPFGDASILPTHLLSRFAREDVTVALGGDGADEVLAGYPTFAAERAARAFRRLPRPARALAGAAVQRLPVDHGNISLDFKLKQFLRGASEPRSLAHQRWIGSFSGTEIARLLVAGDAVPGGVEAEHMRRAAALAHNSDPLTQSLLLYQDTYLPDDILTKIDRASMACSLEVRAPMLDAHMIDWLSALPAAHKYGKGRTKRLLKAAAAGKLPPKILERHKKGFGIPVARWLRGPLSPLVDRLLQPELIYRQGLFRPEAISQLVAEHRAGRKDHRKPLWTLLMFQLWREHWLDRD
jgi:asparagine synthase (glutamine-hydrolysing)